MDREAPCEPLHDLSRLAGEDDPGRHTLLKAFLRCAPSRAASVSSGSAAAPAARQPCELASEPHAIVLFPFAFKAILPGCQGASIVTSCRFNQKQYDHVQFVAPAQTTQFTEVVLGCRPSTHEFELAPPRTGDCEGRGRSRRLPRPCRPSSRGGGRRRRAAGGRLPLSCRGKVHAQLLVVLVLGALKREQR